MPHLATKLKLNINLGNLYSVGRGNMLRAAYVLSTEIFSRFSFGIYIYIYI